ncbi:MAG: EAL domain-containing protein [Deltaproteobacteria bacterium]|nr:EAL domain-containing protein [Deltaproteobacteria bacterium]
MTIFRRNFLAIFLLLLISTVITGLFWAHEQNTVMERVHLESAKVLERDYRKNFQERCLYLVNLLEETLSPHLALEDAAKVQSFARLAQKHPLVNTLVVFDRDRKMLFHSETSSSAADRFDQILSRGAGQEQSLAGWQEGGTLHLLKNIRQKDHFIGGFYLELPLSGRDRFLNSLQGRLHRIKQDTNHSRQVRLIGIGFFLLVLGMGLSYWVARYINRPIPLLAQAIKSIRKREYDIDIPAGDDEIGRLGQDLRELAADLKNTTVSKDYLEMLFSSMQDSLVVVSRNGTIQIVNRSFVALTGADAESLVGKKIWDFLEIEQGSEKPSLSENGPTQTVTGMTCRLRIGAGPELLVSVAKMPKTGKEEGDYIFLLRDVSKQRWLVESIRFNATHDSLTGLSNRGFFLGELEKAVQSLREGSETHFALLFIDLDRFKRVNETFGHHVGDAVLKLCAERIRQGVQYRDIVSRLGGDEFVVLLNRIQSETDVWRAAQRVHQELTKPYTVEEHQLILGCSIGVTCSWQAFENPAQLLGNADLAMNEAKKKSSEKVIFFTQGMRFQTEELCQLESDLRTAILHKAIDIQFQPIVSVAGGDLRGFEVLARWNHPERAMIPPALFIPLAERVGLIDNLEWIIFEKAFSQRRQWRQKFPDFPFYLAVNVSGHHLGQISFPVFMGRSFQKYEISPGEIVFEVTESMLMRNPEVATRVLAELKKSGAKLALDDFGTGYSSLSYLSRYPFDYLKIDQSFVRGIEKNPSGHFAKVVEVITRLGHGLEMDVVAEGVEKTTELERIRGFGIDAWQGLLYSCPTDAKGAERLLQDLTEQKKGHLPGSEP